MYLELLASELSQHRKEEAKRQEEGVSEQTMLLKIFQS